MNQLDAAAGLMGAIAVSAAAYAAARRLRHPRVTSLPLHPESEPGLAGAAPGLIGRSDPTPAPWAERLQPIQARRVVPAGRARTPRPGAARPPIEAATDAEGPWELLSLIGTMQWDRALALLEKQAALGVDLKSIAPLAEAAALERVRALPESEARVSLGGYRILATLVPSAPVYADRVAHCLARIQARREALLSALTRDEDRFDPGTVWFNHPHNPRFDDVRRPIWLYVGCRAGHAPRLRLRTNWLGESRISVRGLEVVHDGVTETLTRGPYKIDPDALGWEWRDEEADLYQIEVLRSLVGAGEVILRYRGDPWSCEDALPDGEKRIVGEMIELHDLLCAVAPAPRLPAEV